MLDAINVPNQPGATGGPYDILRVVAAFPLAADFESKSKEVQQALKEDSHPLALLRQSVLVSELATTPEGNSIVTQLRNTLERTRGRP